MKEAKRSTHRVSTEVFRRVYDSPRALPGKYRWVTVDVDVRKIEELLGIPSHSIGAPLWVSGDTQKCRCGREINWLDIVSSALASVHSADMLVRVILGDSKFVNTEAPRAIANVKCSSCATPILDLRSFKCHNWAYAVGDIGRIIEARSSAVQI